jgi:hypothetical protein
MPVQGGDLAGAGYPTAYAPTSLLGGLSNSSQSNIPARSNLEWFGLNAATDGALAATGVGCVVAVPVTQGLPISKVSIVVGATAGATMTHSFAAVYPGSGVAVNTGVPLAQSTDAVAGAFPASALYTFTLASTVYPNATSAPQNFVYVMLALTGATIPTALSVGTPTGINYQWNGTASPAFLSATTGTGLAGTAPNPMGTLVAKAVAPVVFLT